LTSKENFVIEKKQTFSAYFLSLGKINMFCAAGWVRSAVYKTCFALKEK
jgi:hypothetical protein